MILIKKKQNKNYCSQNGLNNYIEIKKIDFLLLTLKIYNSSKILYIIFYSLDTKEIRGHYGGYSWDIDVIKVWKRIK